MFEPAPEVDRWVAAGRRKRRWVAVACVGAVACGVAGVWAVVDGPCEELGDAVSQLLPSNPRALVRAEVANWPTARCDAVLGSLPATAAGSMWDCDTEPGRVGSETVFYRCQCRECGHRASGVDLLVEVPE